MQRKIKYGLLQNIKGITEDAFLRLFFPVLLIPNSNYDTINFKKVLTQVFKYVNLTSNKISDNLKIAALVPKGHREHRLYRR